MEEDTTLTVRGNEIKIPKEYVIIIRGDFRHAGSAYEKLNYRLHIPTPKNNYAYRRTKLLKTHKSKTTSFL